MVIGKLIMIKLNKENKKHEKKSKKSKTSSILWWHLELRETGDLKQYYVYKCSKCGKTPVRWYEARLFAWSARRIWNKRSKK